MKEIKAYIRHENADVVIEKLEEAGVKGMTLMLLLSGLIRKHSASQ